MTVRRLPDNPDFEHLKNEARMLQRHVRASDPVAVAEVRERHPAAGDLSAFRLADAQLVVARG